MKIVKNTMQEARKGNFNARLRSQVLRFLRGLNRPDVRILSRESNVDVNWIVDCGAIDLQFTFTNDEDTYVIDAKDEKDLVETWTGEFAELNMDLEDTIAFVSEFKKSLADDEISVKDPAVKESTTNLKADDDAGADSDKETDKYDESFLGFINNLGKKNLNEKLFNDEGDDAEVIIEILTDKGNWEHVGQEFVKGKGFVYSVDRNSRPKVFKSVEDAKNSGFWDQLLKDGYVEDKNLRVCDSN